METFFFWCMSLTITFYEEEKKERHLKATTLYLSYRHYSLMLFFFFQSKEKGRVTPPPPPPSPLTAPPLQRDSLESHGLFFSTTHSALAEGQALIG